MQITGHPLSVMISVANSDLNDNAIQAETELNQWKDGEANSITTFTLCIAPCKINLILEGTNKASLSKLVLLFPVEYFMLYPHSVHYCDKDSLF